MRSARLSEASATGEFEAWVRPHVAAMRRFAVSLSGLPDADDLVQDALLRAWSKWSQYQPGRGSPTAWLLAIVADRARKGRLRRHPAPRLDDQIGLPAGADLETRLDLRRAINSLPARQRQAIVLHHYVDLSVADVAAIMHCSTGTVKSTLHDGRNNLARQMGDDHD